MIDVLIEKEKLDEAIWKLRMIETMHRNSGDPIPADLVREVRVLLTNDHEEE